MLVKLVHQDLLVSKENKERQVLLGSVDHKEFVEVKVCQDRQVIQDKQEEVDQKVTVVNKVRLVLKERKDQEVILGELELKDSQANLEM